MAKADQLRRALVAVVDDDQRILESLNILLESADYEVRLFSSATALLNSDDLPDIACLISDVAMPEMDGLGLVRALREARCGLPVILLTGRPDLLDGAPSDWRGQYRVFTKPFDAQDLLTAVDDGLRRLGARTRHS